MEALDLEAGSGFRLFLPAVRANHLAAGFKGEKILKGVSPIAGWDLALDVEGRVGTCDDVSHGPHTWACKVRCDVEAHAIFPR